jgi:hypothetical protein
VLRGAKPLFLISSPFPFRGRGIQRDGVRTTGKNWRIGLK